MNSEAEKVNANPEQIRKILSGDPSADWYLAFTWSETPQKASHWINIKDGVKSLTKEDRKYLKSLLGEEDKMTG